MVSVYSAKSAFYRSSVDFRHKDQAVIDRRRQTETDKERDIQREREREFGMDEFI